jgi:hypothetical protein
MNNLIRPHDVLWRAHLQTQTCEGVKPGTGGALAKPLLFTQLSYYFFGQTCMEVVVSHRGAPGWSTCPQAGLRASMAHFTLPP